MKKDLEGYLAIPFRWLAKWANVSYDGEWRNACAAHIGWGWALALTIMEITPFLLPLVIIYPIWREMIDAQQNKVWNNKNLVDMLTFYAGECIGIFFGVFT